MSSPPWDYIAKLVCIGDSGCGKSSLTIRLCEGRFSPHHDVTIGVEFGSRIVPVGPPHFSPQSNSSFATSLPPSAAPADADDDGSGANTASGTGTSAPGGLPEPPRAPDPTPQAPQKHMKLSLWDTAGQETYKSVTRSYFRGASGALLVFDLSRKQTFQHVTDWLHDLRQIAEPDIVVILVGNKADLIEEDEEEEGEEEENQGKGGQEAAPSKGKNVASSASNSKKKSKREVPSVEAREWARRNGILEYVETSAKSGANVEMAFTRVAERIYQNIQAGKYDLNDRRSGVKGPSAGGNRTNVRLGADSAKSSGGVCC